MPFRSAVAALGLLLAAAPAGAQTLEDYDYENLSFRGIGFDIGYIWPSKVESTNAWGMRVDMGYLGPGLRIVPTLGYWNSTIRSAELDRLADQINQLPALREAGVEISGADLGRISWSDLAVGLDGQFVWLTPVRGLQSYLGVGVAAHILNGRGESIEDTFVEDLLDSITAGFTGIAGAEYEVLERFRVFGEARYTLMSDLHFGGLHIGGAVTLPTPEAASRRGLSPKAPTRLRDAGRDAERSR